MMDLSALMRDYRSHWYWFVISIFVCALIGIFIVSRHRDKYEVAASMLIEDNDKSGLANMNLDVASVLTGATANVDDELFLVSSHTVYKDVARELGLDHKRFKREGFMDWREVYEEWPLDVVAPPIFADTAEMSLVFRMKVHPDNRTDIKVINDEGTTVAELDGARLPATVKTDYGTFNVVPTKYYNPKDPEMKFRVHLRSYDTAAEELAEDISAEMPSKKANAIRLLSKTYDTKFTRKLLNTVLEHYNSQGMKRTNNKNQATIDFLDERISSLLGQIRTNDDQIRDFKQDEGIVDIASEGEYNLKIKGEVAQKLFNAETQLQIMMMAREFLATPGNEYALVPYQNVSTADNPTANDGLNELVSTYNTLVLERMQMATNARPDNIALRKLSDQLDALRQNIILTMNKVAESGEVAVQELKNQYNLAQKGIGRFPGQEHEYVNIYRDRELLNALYTFLLQKREETAIMLANIEPKGRIVDEAYTLGDPVNLSSKMILAIAVLFGLFIPLIGIYLLRIFRTKFASRAEIENATNIPILGEVCATAKDTRLIVTPGSTSAAAELFKLIRTNLQFVLSGTAQKVVLFTSSHSGEGKSFISINTAAALAMTGKRVVLIGMDIRKPRLAEYLGLPEHTGVTQWISNPECPLNDIIIKDPLEVKGLDVILSGPVPPNPSELLLMPRVDTLFKELRSRYDYIIVDSAPIGLVSDTFSLARIADATVFVMRLNVTTKEEMANANSIFEDKRLPHIGIVVNGTEGARRYTYGYGDNGKKKRGLFGLKK